MENKYLVIFENGDLNIYNRELSEFDLESVKSGYMTIVDLGKMVKLSRDLIWENVEVIGK